MGISARSPTASLVAKSTFSHRPPIARFGGVGEGWSGPTDQAKQKSAADALLDFTLGPHVA